MNAKTKEVQETNRNAHRQLMEVMVEKCGARGLAECDGPNGATLRFWNVNGFVVITHEYKDGNGWEYYLSGRRHKVAEIPSDIRQATNEQNVTDELVKALEALEPHLNTEAQMLDYASLNEGRASDFGVASMKARRALALAKGEA